MDENETFYSVEEDSYAHRPRTPLLLRNNGGTFASLGVPPAPSVMKRSSSDMALHELGNRLVPDMSHRSGSSSALTGNSWSSLPATDDPDMKELLAWYLLQFSAPIVRPRTSSTREELPSSEEVEDHTLRVIIDTSFLDGKSPFLYLFTVWFLGSTPPSLVDRY